jgi:hypothetical protein
MRAFFWEEGAIAHLLPSASYQLHLVSRNYFSTQFFSFNSRLWDKKDDAWIEDDEASFAHCAEIWFTVAYLQVALLKTPQEKAARWIYFQRLKVHNFSELCREKRQVSHHQLLQWSSSPLAKLRCSLLLTRVTPAAMKLMHYFPRECSKLTFPAPKGLSQKRGFVLGRDTFVHFSPGTLARERSKLLSCSSSTCCLSSRPSDEMAVILDCLFGRRRRQNYMQLNLGKS